MFGWLWEWRKMTFREHMWPADHQSWLTDHLYYLWWCLFVRSYLPPDWLETCGPYITEVRVFRPWRWVKGLLGMSLLVCLLAPIANSQTIVIDSTVHRYLDNKYEPYVCSPRFVEDKILKLFLWPDCPWVRGVGDYVTDGKTDILDVVGQIDSWRRRHLGHQR